MISKKPNPAYQEALKQGRWVNCPACLTGFLDLHYCGDPGCERLKCNQCDFVLDPRLSQWHLKKELVG